MEALSKALAYAMAYLGTVERESDSDAHYDVQALEVIASELGTITSAERTALQKAAETAIAAEQKATQPNYSLIDGYNSVIEHLTESEA